MKMNQDTKFKIVVISIITAFYLLTGVLFVSYCSKTGNWNIMPYIFSIATFSFIVAIYAFISSNNKRKKEDNEGEELEK